jgi:putative DNA primase/helicase
MAGASSRKPQEVELILMNNNNSDAYSQSAMNIADLIKTDIAATGMPPPDHIEFGKVIRFSDDGRKNRNGWCIAFQNPDGSTAASFGNWKDIQEKRFYTSNGSTMTQEDKAIFSQQIKKAIEKAKQEQIKIQAAAAAKAKEIWNNAKQADLNHGYLVKKQVEPYGLKQSGKALIIPVMNFLGDIISLQEILPDGKKKFFPGGKVKGGCFIIGDIKQDSTFYICEGYATGATIHKTTNKPVIMAFNSGNLKSIAPMCKAAYPSKTIIIAADNDLETEQRTGKNMGWIAAEKAAGAIGAELTLCPVNSDFNDLQQAQGIGAVKQALKKTQTVNIDDWEEPIPLQENNPPGLDTNLLPGIIGDMARAVSIETETPFELAAGLILSVLGTACQGKFIVKIKPGYQEPVNIWTVTALDPANRKSSVLMKITKPLSQWESDKHQELEPFIKEAASKLQNQEARIKSLRAQYGKAQQENLREIEKEIFDIENNLVQVPLYPKLWAQDVTPEHLGTLLNIHDEKMSIVSAEGGIFDILGGRYSNGVANLDLFLQGHSGDPVRVDRGSRKPVLLNNPALTLGLSPQPEVLRGLVDKPGFRGKGLLARFLYLLPKSNLGYRGLESDPVPENIKINYQNLISQILNIEAGEDEQGNRQPYILHFSKKTFQEWLDFSRMVEVELREGGRFEHITDWAGKLPGAAARIAGLLHCAKNPSQPWAKWIDIETMQNALEIAATLSEHALIAFDMMGADRSLDQARKVWRWIEQSRYETFTKRDCFNALKGTFHRVVNIEEPVKVLIERNYIQGVTEKTGGRPSIKYCTNPSILKRWL